MSNIFQTALPAYHHLTPPQPLSPSATLQKLQTYLKATETQPHLRPDAIFTDHTITTSIPTADGGIVLHQLRRVESALQGVRLQSKVSVDLMAFDMGSAGVQGRWEKLKDSGDQEGDAQNGETQMNSSAKKRKRGEDITEEQMDNSQPTDLSYNEQMLAQEDSGILEGEIDERHNVVLDEADLVAAEDWVDTSKSLKRKASSLDKDGKISKEERKRLKKEKMMEARRETQKSMEDEAHRRKSANDLKSNQVSVGEDEEMQRQIDLPEENDPPVDVGGEQIAQKRSKQTHQEADEDVESIAEIEEEPKKKKTKKSKTHVNGHAKVNGTEQTNGADAVKEKKQKKKKAPIDDIPASSQISLGEVAKDSPLAYKKKKNSAPKDMNGINGPS